MKVLNKISHKKILFFSILSFGLLIRLIPLLTKGTSDVDEMISWIERIEANGWANGYSGIYFPSSYLIFYTVYKVSQLVSTNIFFFFAVVRFLFELIFLASLIFALKYKFINQALLILLWVNPLFIILSFAGYTDIFSISMWFLFIFLVYKSEIPDKQKIKTLIAIGGVFAFFAFLKPQTLYLALLIMFFLVLFYAINRINLKIIGAIFLAFFAAFLIYGKLLNPATILSCGEKLGPITISSFTDSPEVFWNKCIDRDNVMEKYPNTGPQICIDAQYEAYAPIGDAGYCVKKFEFSDSSIKEVFIARGLFKLANQVVATSDVMTSYSANMPNIWALYVKNANFYEENKSVWRFYASKEFNKNVIAINIILIFVLTVYLFFIFRKEKLSYILIFVGLPLTILVPNFATMAHENHFALGSLISALGISALSKTLNHRDKLTTLLYSVWFMINFFFALNIMQLYVADIWITQSENNTLIAAGESVIEYLNPYLNIYHISYINLLLFIIFLVLFILAISKKEQKDKELL